MQFKTTIIAAALAAAMPAWANVSPEEAKQLGATLTAVGAEKAGNKDGTIPEYTGGLTNGPAVAKGSGMRPDPYASDKPRLVITGKNLQGQEDKLTVGTRELLKRFPSFRVDVYPTRRSVAFPKFVQDNAGKNALNAKAVEGGLGVEGAVGSVPFPIPKSGYEAMWNHLLAYKGRSIYFKYDSWNVDASGTPALATTGEIWEEFPLADAKRTDAVKPSDVFFRTKLNYTAPARRAGEGVMAFDAINPLAQPRKVWQYLPGQRRVKLAPDVAYDTPNPGSAGASTYDDSWLFNGAMDRFDFKLLGKKEIIVPYNDYKLAYHKNVADVTTPHHVNPDLVRWELHRVWVVEANLKPGKRHIYGKRVFYIDEDSWVTLASDAYDARGQLYRAAFTYLTYSYDVQAPQTDGQAFYDFVAGVYNVTGLAGQSGGIKYIDPLKPTEWSAEALSGAGVR